WGRLRPGTLSGWTQSSSRLRSCTRAITTTSTDPAPCSRRWCTPGCTARRAAAVSITTRHSLCRRYKRAENDRKEKIKQFLSKLVRNHDLQDDEDIFARGFINSLAALQLVNFLEKEFGIAV